jgi:hypothetical protein
VIAPVLPDDAIGSSRQAPVADMGKTGIQIRELCEEPRSEILIEA